LRYTILTADQLWWHQYCSPSPSSSQVFI